MFDITLRWVLWLSEIMICSILYLAFSKQHLIQNMEHSNTLHEINWFRNYSHGQNPEFYCIQWSIFILYRNPKYQFYKGNCLLTRKKYQWLTHSLLFTSSYFGRSVAMIIICRHHTRTRRQKWLVVTKIDPCGSRKNRTEPVPEFFSFFYSDLKSDPWNKRE